MRSQPVAIAVSALLLTACGGGGLPAGSVVNSPGGGPTSPPTKLVNVKVTVTVPPSEKGRQIRPNYVSVNTESLVIELASVNGEAVVGVNPTTINTLAYAHDCKQESGGIVCSAIASGSPGADVFDVTTYDGINATGAVLSVGTVQAKIDGGADGVQISNRLSLTLEGIVAGLRLSLSPEGAKRGDRAKAAVALAAYDASGAQIVGPSKFSASIALAIQGDAQRAFLLEASGKRGSSLTIVKPLSGITLEYDGNVQASSVTVAATVDGPGSNGASANFSLQGRQPPPPVGTIYALNLGTNDGLAASVTEYDGNAKGNAQPERTLQLNSKLYARSIAVDSKGDLYVGYFDSALGFSISSGTPDKGNEVAIYAPGASGNQQPAKVLTFDSKSKTTIFPIFMAFDAAGGLVTYGATTVDGNAGDNAVLTYASGSSGATPPSQSWAFASPTIEYQGPSGLALDSAGNFYVNGTLHTPLAPSYGLFVATASDNGNPSVNPSRTLPWDSTTELTPSLTTNVAVSGSGEIFIANAVTSGSGYSTSCQGRANVYSAGTGGGITDVKPLRVLTLSGVIAQSYTCTSPRNPLVPYFPSITLYDTTLFVADDFNNAIDAFSANAHGIVKPSLQITGSATGLNAPVALVVTSTSGQPKGLRDITHVIHYSTTKKDISK
jgi:hypothetical protein